MRDFIEKMAVWYEFRYPDYEINRLMPCCSICTPDDDNVVNKVFDFRKFDFNQFMSLLSIDEKYLLSLPCYISNVKIDSLK